MIIEFDDSVPIPFRPCAMMLKVNPLYRIKPGEIVEDTIRKIKDHIDAEVRSFDHSLKPDIVFGAAVSSPMKALSHIDLMLSGDDPKMFFELGFTAQQILLFLSYLRLSYSIYFDNRRMLIAISPDISTKVNNSFNPGFANVVMPLAKDLLYFESWGIHPELFFEDNPKLDSVIRYCRYAPRIMGCGELKFIMNKEYLHLMLMPAGKSPVAGDYLNAGFLLLNFIISAEMLSLMGEWKLLREMDVPDKTAFDIPHGAYHIATWHGQLF
jgi:hypothetical protein